MKPENVNQRSNASVAGNAGTSRRASGRSPLGRYLALPVFLAAAIVPSLVGSADTLPMSASAAPGAIALNTQRADLIDDIIDLLDGILGGGSGSGSGSGSGGGSTP